VTFPENTPVVVDLSRLGQSEKLYPNPTQFDPFGRADKLSGVDSHGAVFGGVGDAGGPRSCVATELSLEIMITALQSIYYLEGYSKQFLVCLFILYKSLVSRSAADIRVYSSRNFKRWVIDGESKSSYSN